MASEEYLEVEKNVWAYDLRRSIARTYASHESRTELLFSAFLTSAAATATASSSSSTAAEPSSASPIAVADESSASMKRARKRRKREPSGSAQGNALYTPAAVATLALQCETLKTRATHDQELRSRFLLPTTDPSCPSSPAVDLPTLAASLQAWAKLADELHSFSSLKYTECQDFELSELTSSGDASDCLFFNHVVTNSDGRERNASVCGAAALIPRRSTFLMSDLSRMQPLYAHCQKQRYDVVVLDPPWRNISASRKKLYQTLDERELLEIRLDRIVSPRSCVVACWVTNKPRYHRFVKEQLFARWRLRYLQTWHWVKVRPDMECVVTLDSTMRRPYEAIIIGCRGDEESLPDDVNVAALKESLTIFSLPYSHSRKPQLNGLIVPKENSLVRCIELFARNLVNDCTSWGNEVLLFQNSSFFLEVQHQAVTELQYIRRYLSCF